MARKYEVNIRVTIDSKCKDSDDDIIEELMYGADKYFYPYCCNNLLAELKNRLKISIFLWRKSCASR